MFGTLPPYMSLLRYANFDPLNILSSIYNTRGRLYSVVAYLLLDEMI